MKKPRIDFSAIDTYRENIAQSAPLPSLSPLEPVNDLPAALLDPAPWNARRFFDRDQLHLLGQDMVQNGQIHPIMVRPKADERFEVVVGERRLRAAQMAGITSLRCNIRQLSNREARRIGLSENLQRQDLNDYEETIGWLDFLALELESLPEFKLFCKKHDDLRITVAQVLNRFLNEFKGKKKFTHNVMGKSASDFQITGSPIEQVILEVFKNAIGMTWQSFVTNRLPILNLPSDLLDVMHRGELEYTKARELSKIKDTKVRADLLERVLQLSLPLTQVKSLVKDQLEPPPQSAKYTKQFQTRLRKIIRYTDTLDFQQRTTFAELLDKLEQLLES
jgi:ParB family transcriptional regulator, chromosome partitioning protein